MGWTGTRNYYLTIDEFFEHEFKSIKWIGKGALIHLKEYYRCAEDEDGKRFVFFSLMDFHKSDGCDIFFKEMTECSLPYYYNCPARILALAEKTPPVNENSRLWRERVHEVLSRKERAKTLKQGDVIKFEHEFNFTWVGKHDTFVVAYKPYARRKTVVLKTLDGAWVSIPNWRSMKFKVVG
jgi:hypothetical protein